MTKAPSVPYPGAFPAAMTPARPSEESPGVARVIVRTVAKWSSTLAAEIFGLTGSIPRVAVTWFTQMDQSAG